MELYFLNRSFTQISCPIDDFTSAVWSEKYYEVGDFTVHMPKAHFSVAKDAVYIRTDFDENGECKCGRIHNLTVNADGDCTVSGVLLEGLLSDRVMYRSGEKSGNVKTAALEAVSEHLRSLPVTIDEDGSDDVSGEAVLSWEWDKMSEWLYGVLRPYGASYTVKLHLGDSTPKLRIVCGEDVSDSVVFSGDYGSIASLEYEKESGGLRNLAFIEGGDGSIVVLSKYAYDRRELYKSAKDVSPDSYDTDEEYRNALRQKGEESLAKYPTSIKLSAEAAESADGEYGSEYKLGDVCGIRDSELGIKTVLRLTSADTVQENGKVSVYPYFGETIRWRDLL